MNVLFVCTGNICRSPMAEGVFRLRAAECGLGGEFEVKSCGTGAWEGLPPSPEAVEAVRRLGGDIEGLASSPCTADLLDWADIVFCMERRHLRRLADDFPEHAGKLELLCADGEDVADPIGLGLETYLGTAALIDREIRKRMDVLCK